jgi:CheY-like chemotaxis protein
MMRVRAEQRGIGLAVEFAGEIPETIRTDGARLRQALVNLMGNAVKFTERGGVRIVAAFIPSWKEAPAVRIDVIDTGIGINAEKLSQLFQPFSQADPSTSRKYGGTGLGLTIARHIAELLGGTLTVQSAPGQGSTFTLTVPTGDIEGVLMVHGHGEAVRGAAAGAVLRTQDLPSLAGLRILLAEDGIDNQRLIKTLLTLSGAEVRIAEDGREAVTLAQTGAFDVVLMDMQMPEMDGYEATRILRQAGYDRPILALTAHVMEGDRERCLEVGCNDHLTKPVDRRRLIGAVALYAGRLAMESGGRAEPASEPSPSPLPLRSAYAEDPDLAPILVDFVEGLAGQVERMRLALGGGAYEELKRQAHQLKGAGGSYGYPSLTDTAKRLEEAAKAHDTEAAGMALGRLAALCDAIVRGAAAEPAPREARS